MRMYLVLSGLLYFVLVLAHVARLVAEGTSVASSPMFSLATIAAALMTVWSWRLLRAVRDGLYNERCRSQRHGSALCSCALLHLASFTANLLEPS